VINHFLELRALPMSDIALASSGLLFEMGLFSVFLSLQNGIDSESETGMVKW